MIVSGTCSLRVNGEVLITSSNQIHDSGKTERTRGAGPLGRREEAFLFAEPPATRPRSAESDSDSTDSDIAKESKATPGGGAAAKFALDALASTAPPPPPPAAHKIRGRQQNKQDLIKKYLGPPPPVQLVQYKVASTLPSPLVRRCKICPDASLHRKS